MTRTIVAYGLMAVLIAAGLGIGLWLRRNSRERWYRRLRDRERSQREAAAAE